MRITLYDVTTALETAWFSPRAPHAVEFAISLLMALQVWSLWESTRHGPNLLATPSAAVKSGRPRSAASDLSRLVDAHLFAESPIASAPITPAVAPSAFKLVGLYVPAAGEAITASEPAFEASGAGEGEISPLEWARQFFGDKLRSLARPGAIGWLSLSGAPGQRVQVGESIGGAKVLEIRDDGVTLELGGRRMRVAYPENPYLAMFRGESDQVAVMADADSIPAELASKLLRFQPEQGPSGLTGFRLYPGSDAQSFVNSGLRAGDVLEAIDGTPITAARDLLPLLRAVRDTKPVRLRLRRAAKSLDLRLFRAAADSLKASSPIRRSGAPEARPGASRTPTRPLASMPSGATPP